MSVCHLFAAQEDQLSTLTGQNLALKRENESLHARLKRSRCVYVHANLTHSHTHSVTHSLTYTPSLSHKYTPKHQHFCSNYSHTHTHTHTHIHTHTHHSVGSPKEDPETPLHRQRSSSLTHRRRSSGTEASGLLRRQSINRSSPEVDLAGKKKTEKEKVCIYTPNVCLATRISVWS